jgi:predicted signal transduction protein with EAL and GGDEF domain
LIDADVAMYRAKRRERDRDQVVELREALPSTQRSTLATDLGTAIADGALSIAYQPIVRTADGLVTGVEALLRWNHPGQGPVSPVTAIGIAEQSGLVSEIGRWVLENSCRATGRGGCTTSPTGHSTWR